MFLLLLFYALWIIVLQHKFLNFDLKFLLDVYQSQAAHTRFSCKYL